MTNSEKALLKSTKKQEAKIKIIITGTLLGYKTSNHSVNLLHLESLICSEVENQAKTPLFELGYHHPSTGLFGCRFPGGDQEGFMGIWSTI